MSIKRKLLGTVGLLVLAAVPAFASLPVHPGPRSTLAPSGKYGFQTVPRYGWGQPSRGSLYVLGEQNDVPAQGEPLPRRIMINRVPGKMVWQRELPNFPTGVFVRDDGKYVLTIDTYADRPEQPKLHALILYGPSGKILTHLAPAQFLTPAEMRSGSPSFLWWDKDMRISWEQVRGKDAVTLTFHWGKVLRINLATGRHRVKAAEGPAGGIPSPPGL